MDRVLGKDNDDPSSYVESASSSSMISLSQDVSTSTVSDEVDHEEEVAIAIAIDDSLTHPVFSMSSIMDFEIHMPDLSHLVHASPLDGAQPSDFQDAYLAKSSPSSVFPLTILDPMCFCTVQLLLCSWHSFSEPP